MEHVNGTDTYRNGKFTVVCFIARGNSSILGPNQIIPADSLYTIEPSGRVKLRLPEYGKAIETNPPISVPGLLSRTVEKYPDTPALCHKLPNGKWNKITYRYILI